MTITVLALLHAIMLGRHTDIAMSVLYVALALGGLVLLARLYRGVRSQEPKARSEKAGVAS